MIYFISDLHLGARYLSRHEAENRVVRFLDSIAADATELYLLGDILDYWYEYRYVVPRGFVRFFGALARLADAGVKITWFTGNHDIWLFDYLRNEIGMTVVDNSLSTTLMGHTFFMAHGDRLGRETAGFRILQRVFRNRLCQLMFAAVHPRWTVPLGFGWSSKNRGFKTSVKAEFTDKMRTRIMTWAEDFSRSHPHIEYIVLGHMHVPVDERLSTGARLLILGEWIHRSTYAVYDGNSVKLLEFEGQKP